MLQAHKNNGTTLSSGYRYSFNGKEKIDEVSGSGNSIDFGARIYDCRIGRWLSRDPKSYKFASHSPYIAFNNNPIFYIDLKGAEWTPPGSSGQVHDMGDIGTQSITSVFGDMRSIPTAYHGETYKYTSNQSGQEYYFVFDANLTNCWQLYTYHTDDQTFQKGLVVYGAKTVEGARKVASDEVTYTREGIYENNMWDESQVQKTPDFVVEHVDEIMEDVKKENVAYEEIKVVEVQVRLNPEMPDHAVAVVKDELSKVYGPEVNIVVIKEPKPAPEYLDSGSEIEVEIGGSSVEEAESGSTGEWNVNNSEKITVIYELKLKKTTNP